MRPSTLKEAIERVLAGEPRDVVLAELVDSFLLADPQTRFSVIEQEPAASGDVRLDALAGAIAEYLAKRYRLGRVPAWASQDSRVLSQPWFTTSSLSLAMHEYLAFASPAEFRWRNIFTEEQPLRRARSAGSFETPNTISSTP
jgi:hypothetical protein